MNSPRSHPDQNGLNATGNLHRSKHICRTEYDEGPGLGTEAASALTAPMLWHSGECQGPLRSSVDDDVPAREAKRQIDGLSMPTVPKISDKSISAGTNVSLSTQYIAGSHAATRFRT